MALLKVENLSAGYDGKKAIGAVDFIVASGEYLCVIGENGSGKSTLMKTILGLLSPMEGNVAFGEGLKKNEIGYLPQQTEVQKDFPASVREIVLSGCLNRCGLRPFYNHAEKTLAEKNMERLAISNLSGACYRELSGGQQQRVLLARALCATGTFLLLDEPTAGLDPNAAMDLYQIIWALNQEEGITVMMISHDMDSVIRYASHILLLGGQKPLFSGSKEDYLKTDMGKTCLDRMGGGNR